MQLYARIVYITSKFTFDLIWYTLIKLSYATTTYTRPCHGGHFSFYAPDMASILSLPALSSIITPLLYLYLSHELAS